MACIDKSDARELVEKHRELFKMVASRGEDSLEAELKKVSRMVYMMKLLTKVVFIGAAWLLLSTCWCTEAGTLALLLIAMSQAKVILDRDISGLDDIILEAVKHSGILEEVKFEKTNEKSGDVGCGLLEEGKEHGKEEASEV